MNDWSMEEVMGFLAPLIDDLDQIPRLAHKKYRTYDAGIRLEHDPRAQASCTYCHMVAEAERRFLDRQRIVLKDLRGLKVWLIEDKAVLRWKKMDEDGRSRNYPTKQAQDFDRGHTLPGLPPKAARVSAGYLLDPTQTEFVRAQVARPRGKTVDWCVAIVPASESTKRWVDVTRESWMG